MIFSTLVSLSLLVASVAAVPTPVLEARASPSATIYMRIEGPTKTIYEKTIVAKAETSLTHGGHTAKHCNGSPKTAPGVTSIVALSQTGQYFEANWNGTTFGDITKLNNTKNNENQQWGALINNAADGGTNGGGIILQGGGDGEDLEYQNTCYQTLPNKQHFLYAFFGDIDATDFLIMSGPKTAKVGQTVQYAVPYAPDGGVYVNDLSVDTTTGQRVYGKFGNNNGESASVSIKFTKAGTYNMKAHCPSGSACVRSNHVVTVVS